MDTVEQKRNTIERREQNAGGGGGDGFDFQGEDPMTLIIMGGAALLVVGILLSASNN
jgi:hypothetical protein